VADKKKATLKKAARVSGGKDEYQAGVVRADIGPLLRFNNWLAAALRLIPCPFSGQDPRPG